MFDGGTYLRGLWEQKPPQWGPVPAVQSILKDRLERYGISWENVSIAMPMWEPGDQHDYSKNGSVGVNFGASFKNNNQYYNTTAYHYLPFDKKTFSMFVRSKTDNTTPSVRKRVFRIYDATHTLISFDYYINGVEAVYYDADNGGKYLNTGEGTHTAGSDLLTVSSRFYSQFHILGGDTLWDHYIPDLDWHRYRTIGSGILGGTPTSLVIGSHIGSLGLQGEVDFFFLTSDILSENQRNLLSDNPYQLWQPPTFRTYSLPASTPTIFNLAALAASRPTRIIH